MNAAIALIIFRLLVAGICAAGSAYLAAHGTDGWGWFLIGAVWLGSITVRGGEVRE